MADYLTFIDNKIAKYTDAETLYAFWLSTPEAVAELLPPPLEPLEVPLVMGFVADYPKVNSDIPYMAGGLLLFCTYEGEGGGYFLSFPENDDYPVFSGREVLGFPKKMGKLGMEHNGDTMTGFIERRGIRLFDLEVELNGQPNSPLATEILAPLLAGAEDDGESEGVTFLFKFAHGVEAGQAFEHPPQLVRQVTTTRAKELEFGTAKVTTLPSPYDSPWGKLPVVELLGGMRTLADNTMLPGKVLTEVNGEAFLPYSFLKYEW
jgi:acetoacetate decarboxylase